MSFWDKYVKKFLRTPISQPAPVPQPAGPHMSASYTYGCHACEDPTVFFLNPSQGIRRKIVDKDGCILNFPGVETAPFWADLLSPNALQPLICFRTEFAKKSDERHIMLWQVQPDGRYWADEDGFGMENDPEIVLYSFLDSQGYFTDPFRLYSIGTKYYFRSSVQ